MGKVNVSQNRAASLQRETFNITDLDTVEMDEKGEPIEGTGTVYTFSLRALSEMERFGMREFADHLTMRYVTGGLTDPNGDFRKKPEILAMVEDEQGGERPVETSEEAMILFAEMERMQGVKRDVWDDTPREDAYLAKELAIIAETANTVFIQLRARVRQKRAEGLKKKAPLKDSDGPSLTLASDQEVAIPA